MWYKKTDEGTCIVVDIIDKNDEYFKDFTYIDDDKIEACFDGYRIKNDSTGRTAEWLAEQTKSDSITLYAKLKQQLQASDWIITKLAELKVVDSENFEKAKEKYTEILTERASIRKQLSDILDIYPEIKN